MDALAEMIGCLGKEEIRFYKMYTGRTEVKGDRKDLDLFDRIRKEKTDFDDDKTSLSLYGADGSNAYHRLKNRVKTDLGKSLLLQHIEGEEVASVLHHYLLARLFQDRNAYALAEHFLKKAERKASAHEHLELLDLIYSEFIRLSQETVTIDPEEFIRKRQENGEKLRALRQIDDLLATVKYRLKVTQNLSPVDYPVVRLLQETVERLSVDETVAGSTQLRFKVYQAVSQILLQQHDYPNLEDYLLRTYEQFMAERLFNRANHQTKLQMLTYIVNSLFKNGRSAQSLEWAERLMAAMEEHDRLHYDRFLFFYYNALVINYARTAPDRAISLLHELESNPQIRDAQYYLIFVHLNLAIFHHEKGEHRQAVRRLNKLYHHERYAHTSAPLKLRIAVLELLVRLEMGDSDFAEQRLRQVRSEFAAQLSATENGREAQMLGFIEDLCLKGISPRDPGLRQRTATFCASATPSSQDAELVNYNKWIRARVGQ